MTKLTIDDLVGAYPLCTACGKRDVVRDAWTCWSMAEQDWVLKTTFDHFRCDACGEVITPHWQIDATFRKKRIRRLNDALRKGQSEAGTVLITQGVQALGEAFCVDVTKVIAEFDAFTPDNDPHQEHDFAKVQVLGEQLFFKIDYYDLKLQSLSPDPASDVHTKRVMTIMLVSEY